jgi:RNA polymerase-binding transcription factor DksA
MKTLTDDALRDARDKLLDRGDLLRDRLEHVHADLRHVREPAPPEAFGAVGVREKDEVLLAIEKSADAELYQIDSALERMEDDSLGLCTECGREIEAARFAAAPCVTHCKACARDG